jgi:hypothetical protein
MQANNMHSERDRESAEHLVAKQLRNLPLRRAPASLEASVMAAIAAGALHPDQGSTASGNSRDFRRWPLPAQLLFALLCAALAVVLTQQLSGATSEAPALLAGDGLRSSWSLLQALLTVIASLADSLAALLRAMPTTLLAMVAMAAGTSCSLLAGASAIFYRSLRR